MGYTMGYICQKLWDLFDKKRGAWDMGYTGPLDILSKTMGRLRQNYGIYWKKLWDILWDIFVKSYGIYWGILGKTVGCIMEYNRQYF